MTYTILKTDEYEKWLGSFKEQAARDKVLLVFVVCSWVTLGITRRWVVGCLSFVSLMARDCVFTMQGMVSVSICY